MEFRDTRWLLKLYRIFKSRKIFFAAFERLYANARKEKGSFKEILWIDLDELYAILEGEKR
jgi:hypothetical protein